jgi:X-X-X-Leu-X-X-Gly heptad repeat protein
MSVPIDGTGTYNDKSNKLANGNKAMKVAFGTCAHLVTQWNKFTTAKCQQFAQ